MLRHYRLFSCSYSSFGVVSALVETGGATGRENCPEADRLYIFGTDAEPVGFDFGRNGSNLLFAQY